MNKPMKNYWSLAFRELRVQKVTALLILIAIILSTMMTAVIAQSAGILSAMRQQQAITLGGNRHASFVQRTGEEVKIMQQDPRLSFVGTYIQLGSSQLNRTLRLSLLEYQEDVSAVYPQQALLKAGRLPQAPGEIALPEDVLQSMGLSQQLGQTLNLPMSKSLRHGVEVESWEYTADFTLVGITASNYLGYTAGIVTGLAGPGTAAELLPEKYIYYNVDFKIADNRKFQSTLEDLSAELNVPELDIIYNIPYLNALGIKYQTSKSYEKLANIDDGGFGFMLGLLLLLAAGLVIYNILKIAVSRRIKQYGIIRAIGGNKFQLYMLPTLQVLLLCSVGIPLGLLLGLLSSQWILTAATGLLSPEIFLVQSQAELNQLIAENSASQNIFLLASVIITLFFALIATIPAAHYAANVPPTVAMAGQHIKIKRRRHNTPKIRSFERYYARLNLSRSPGRTALTILSLIMSITVFIALQSGLSLLNTAGQVTQHLGDYSIINETSGFSSDDIAALTEMPEVASVATIQLKLYNTDENTQIIGLDMDLGLQPGETFQLVGLNDTYWDALFSKRFSAEEMAQFKSGQACLLRNPLPLVWEGKEIPRTEIKAGSNIRIGDQSIPVLATLDGYDTYLSVGNSGFTNGIQVITSPEVYSRLTGENTVHEIKPILHPNADRTTFDAALTALTQRVPGTTWLSYAETDQQAAASFAKIQMLGWCLILFIGLIGILNIINTVYTNIHTRLNEIGIQRAIGMSTASLYRTFLWEGAYYGLLAAAIGAISGYLCTILINAATSNVLELTPFPLISTLQASIVSVLACLLATLIPLRTVSKTSIVAAIENQE